MARLAAGLPDTGVGLAPELAHALGHRAQLLPLLDGEDPAGVVVVQRRVEQAAVDIELKLVRCAVADADRARVAVAPER